MNSWRLVVLALSASAAHAACNQGPSYVTLGDATDQVAAVAFSADSLWLVSAADKLRLYSQSGIPSLKYTLDLKGDYVAFSPDSKLLAVTGSLESSRRYLVLYALEEGMGPSLKYNTTLPFSMLDTTLQDIAFSADSKLLAVAGNNATFEQQQTATWVFTLEPGADPILKYTLNNSMYPLAASRSSNVSQMLATAKCLPQPSLGPCKNAYQMYSMQEESAPSVSYTIDCEWTSTAAFGDPKWFATSCYSRDVCSSKDSRCDVQVYSLNSPEKFILPDATSYVSTVAFSPDSKLLASGSVDQKVRIYTMGEGAAPPSLKYTLDDATDGVGSVAFSADSARLASGSWDNKVRVYYDFNARDCEVTV